jgi:hypothetical protein
MTPAVAWLERGYDTGGLIRDDYASVGAARQLIQLMDDHGCMHDEICAAGGDSARWPYRNYWGSAYEDEDDLSMELDYDAPLRLWSDWEVRELERV